MGRIYANIIPPTTGNLIAAKMLINNAHIAWREEDFQFPTESSVSYPVEYIGEKYRIVVFEDFVYIAGFSEGADPNRLANAMGLPTKVSFGSVDEFYEYRNAVASKASSSDSASTGLGWVLAASFIFAVFAIASGFFSS